MMNYQDRLTQFLNECTDTSDVEQVYKAVSLATMEEIAPKWQTAKDEKQACYFSAEFLIGRMVYANLYNLSLLEQMRAVFAQRGLDPNMFELIDDAALGNGGLGRLAACFLDSAATQDIPLDGYGIRYRYGLFKQYFYEGFQKEIPDDWLQYGDPWGKRVEEERVMVRFGSQSVWAVPYDMPVIGYGGKRINTLRLWQAEPVHGFDLERFNEQDYDAAFRSRNEALAISAVLYPNDDTNEGKKLRLKQQYFFSSASVQHILRRFKVKHGTNFALLPDHFAIQLNDTHPTVAIAELLRLLMSQEGLPFEQAFDIVQRTFAYTNHTIMAEAMEKWDVSLFCEVVPEAYPYVVMIQNYLMKVLRDKHVPECDFDAYSIVKGNQIHMAQLATFGTHSVNGVAEIHSQILKDDVLAQWYRLYPERFNNKTNGITQRRWLGLCNPEYAAFVTKRIGDGWITNLDEMKKLLPYADDKASQEEFLAIRRQKKQQLAGHVAIHEYNFQLNVDSMLDIQIKRLHEYKRQLLNAFSIVDIYFALKEGKLPDFQPMTFLFGAKAAPGYRRAKGIIKYLNEIAKTVNRDSQTNDRLQVLFVQNYNVSYAEKLIPAADISEQISTAGTEASGTGNMKFMLNGALTLGTYDGANVEIMEEAGIENNFVFGARVEEIAAAKDSYNAKQLYHENPRIRRVVDTLIDGTFTDSSSGMFRELYDALLEGAAWHKPDHYFLLLDFESYVEAKLAANRAYADKNNFARMGIINSANAGKFSSDRTIEQYAKEIWGIG